MRAAAPSGCSGGGTPSDTGVQGTLPRSPISLIAPVFEFSLHLSRACLGKIPCFIREVRQTMGAPHLARGPTRVSNAASSSFSQP